MPGLPKAAQKSAETSVHAIGSFGAPSGRFQKLKGPI